MVDIINVSDERATRRQGDTEERKLGQGSGSRSLKTRASRGERLEIPGDGREKRAERSCLDQSQFGGGGGRVVEVGEVRPKEAVNFRRRP
jgi:hypothetical protein